MSQGLEAGGVGPLAIIVSTTPAGPLLDRKVGFSAYLAPPRTQASVRVIALPRVVLENLTAHLAARATRTSSTFL